MLQHKSTNVRSFEWPQLGFAALQGISPTLAATAASRLFLRTPPRSTRATSTAALPEATRLEIPFESERLATWSWGRGRAVLLVHGWGGRAHQMRSFVEPLLGAGYRVVAFDAPGHGESSGSQLSLLELAAAIRRVADVVGPLEAVVAHSFGAAASAVAIADGLALGRAVFLGPPSDELRWFERFSEHLRLSARTRREAKHLVERRVGAPFSRFSAESLGPSMRLPLLVVHDRLDREVPWDDGFRIARFSPDASLLTTEGLGHRKILRDARVVGSVVAFLGGEVPADHADLDALAEHEPANDSSIENRCHQCEAVAGETWDAAGTLCMRCGLQRELADRSTRWDPVAAA